MYKNLNSFTSAINAAIHQQDNLLGEKKQWVEDWFNHSLNHPRYAIGKNAETRALHALTPLAGLIDDGHIDKFWEGIPLLPMANVPKHAWVMNCATSISPVNVDYALQKTGFERILNIADCLNYKNCSKTLAPHFLIDQRIEMSAYRKKWEDIYQRLEDESSRQVFLDVCRYRLTADPFYMRNKKVRFSDQYFEPFIKFEDDVFVDAGGFDGDTTELFCKNAPRYKRVYLFEPSPANIAAAQKRLASHRDIVFMPIGVSDRQGTLSFDPNAGSASAMHGEGALQINVDTIDRMVTEPVSFIKMDLEGWEMNALKGCRQHILVDKPKLAIAVYHQASHFREIMDYILEINPTYTVRLGHYTQGWSETVMYFTQE